MAQLVERASGIIETQKRMRKLLAANRSIVGELALPKVLQRIVEAARTTADARYAALGVLEKDGTFSSLVHSGMAAEVVAGIEDFPQGRGLLGVMADTLEPVRIAEVGEDPRSVGLPPGHPPVRAFLGVVVRSHGEAYGHLFLAEPLHADAFTEEDEELVAALAATAGIAVENARLYEESQRRQEWLLATSEVSQRLLVSADRENELQNWRLIASRVQHLTDAETVVLIRPTEDAPPRLQVKVASGPDAAGLEDLVYPGEDSLAWPVIRDGRPLVTGAGHDPEQAPIVPGRPVGPSMVLPLRGERGSFGAIAITRRLGAPAFSAADVDMAEDFATQAAIALELAEARSASQRLGALEDRERIARDLHDHVIQRLFATGLTMQSTAGSVGSPAARDRLSSTVEDLDETIRQIRTSIFALKYSAPTVSSIRATVLTVVDDLSPTLGFRPSTHLTGPLDTLADEDLVGDVSAVVGESLTNVRRHAGATSARVSVVAGVDVLTVVVVDDGRGNDQPGRWSGLANVAGRADRRGGSLVVDDAPGGGFRLTWSIPLV